MKFSLYRAPYTNEQPNIMQSLSCATYQLKNGINFNPQRAQQTNKTSIKM